MWVTSDGHLACNDSLAEANGWKLGDRAFDYPILVNDGEPGTPLPFSVRNDNLFAFTLLMCLMVFIIALSRSMYAITQQAKTFFQPSRKDGDDIPSSYPTFHLVMMPVGCLLLAISFYVYTTEHITRDFIFESQHLIVAIFFGCFAAYFLLKWLVYAFVNSVFFGGKKRLQWNHAYLFITSLSATLLLPLVFLQVFFNLSMEKAVIGFIFILFLNKMLTFFKCWSIFFRQKRRFLQNILYFCALEATPLLVFGGIWLAVVNLLKINF